MDGKRGRIRENNNGGPFFKEQQKKELNKKHYNDVFNVPKICFLKLDNEHDNSSYSKEVYLLN